MSVMQLIAIAGVLTGSPSHEHPHHARAGERTRPSTSTQDFEGQNVSEHGVIKPVDTVVVRRRRSCRSAGRDVAVIAIVAAPMWPRRPAAQPARSRLNL